MNEGQKTSAFAVVAIIIAGVAAWVAWPENYDFSRDEWIGKPLFKEFKDALEVARVRIDEYDEKVAKLSSFEAKRDQKSGDWTLPKNSNYPAEATTRIRDLATAFIDLTVLDVASEVQADHAKFGVLAPSDSLELGAEGVGRLVILENEAGDSIVNLIVGKQLKDDATKRFVRVPTQQATNVVTLDQSVLSTGFQSWISSNLLALSAYDIEKLRVRDYSVNPKLQDKAIIRKMDASLSTNATNLWTADELIGYEQGEAKEIEVKEDEQLNGNNLLELLKALNDLNIVNAIRKPEGLSADLKAKDTFRKDQDALESLVGKGFYLDSALSIPDDQKTGDVLGVNGELVATLKNGVEYSLRFGDVAGVSDSQDTAGSIEGVNRYLLVTARINEAKFPKVKEQPIPKTWEELHPELNKEAGEEAEGDEDKPEKEASAPVQLTAEEKQEELEAAQEKTRKANQRAQDARDEQIEEAGKKVRQLNERFADWYYVIAENEYRKIHLTREDILEKKPAEGTQPDALPGPPQPTVPPNQDAPSNQDASQTQPADK